MSIGIALVGAGIFAREEHLPAIDAAKDLALKAFYSRSLKSAQTLASGSSNVELYSDNSGEGNCYKDLLARDDIQAVVISLPILSQPEYIKAALAAKKHVLSEKPIAADLKAAQELIKWYRESVDTSRVIWAVAENFRFMNSFDKAASLVERLGRILTFRCCKQCLVEPEGKYYETAWRKTPGYQGGFVLDGGVHFIAVLRLLLSRAGDPISRLSAFSAQQQKHLPPIDTVDASARTKSGAVGSISLSFGTTINSGEWNVAGEKGSLVINDQNHITAIIDGKEEQFREDDERTGVPPEVRAFAEAIKTVKANSKQSPEEALADLELIERMLKSGEAGGAPVDCEFQL